MDTRRIGSLEVSVIGLGGNNFGTRLDGDATARVVDAALDAGINHFDTADLYGEGASEEYLGRALAGRRERAVIATKFGHERSKFGRGADPAQIRRAVEGSLRRLKTDHVDLLWQHQPDPDTPIEDSLAAMGELVREGKVREIGCSNFNARMLHDADAAARAAGGPRFVAVQNEYSLMHREPEHEVLPECARLDIAFVPYFPLASGLLTGKYRRGRPVPEGTRLSGSRYASLLSARNLDVVEELVRFAEARGHTILELAISWLLAHDVVASVIAGATKPEQVRANATAAAWRLTPEELAEVDAITAPLEEGAAR